MIKKLRLRYDRRVKDFMVHYPAIRRGKGLLFTTFFSKQPSPDFNKIPIGIQYDPSVIEELESLGFDPKTIKFEISLKDSDSEEPDSILEKIKNISTDPHQHLKTFSEEEINHILEALETLKKPGFRELQNKIDNLWEEPQKNEG